MGSRTSCRFSFSRLVNHSQDELDRIGRFLDHDRPLTWDASLKAQNMGTERLRPSPIRDALVQAPVLTTLRQRIVPHQWSQSLKGFWRARIDRPEITLELTERLRDVFDADLAQLGSWLGTELDCDNFHEALGWSRSCEWGRATRYRASSTRRCNGDAGRNVKTVTTSGRMSLSPA